MAGLVETCYYDDPIEVAAARFKASEEWLAITSLLSVRGGEKVLEIGAGRGIMSWAFASSGYEAYAIEPNKSSLVGVGAIRELCATTGIAIHIRKDSAENISFSDETFDHVCCRGVLHHVADLDQACREAFRVLRPGGKFLAIKEHAADTPDELAAFLKAHPLHWLYGGEHAFPLALYKRSIRAAGFRHLKTFGHFDHPISSAPHLTTKAICGMLEHSLALRVPRALARHLSRYNTAAGVYRRWLTARARIPGRLYSFLAMKHR
jgi:ubiquinone/menaquinone biosynthesis C-methylase UbiE